MSKMYKSTFVPAHSRDVRVYARTAKRVNALNVMPSRHSRGGIQL